MQWFNHNHDWQRHSYRGIWNDMSVMFTIDIDEGFLVEDMHHVSLKYFTYTCIWTLLPFRVHSLKVYRTEVPCTGLLINPSQPFWCHYVLHNWPAYPNLLSKDNLLFPFVSWDKTMLMHAQFDLTCMNWTCNSLYVTGIREHDRHFHVLLHNRLRILKRPLIKHKSTCSYRTMCLYAIMALKGCF